MHPLKIRCSRIGEIMAGTLGLTETQQKKLDGYYKRDKPLTDRMKEEVAELEYKRDNPELCKTVINYLAELEVERRTGRSKDIYTKAMEKGTEQEDEAIALLSSVTGKFYLKNEEHLQNDHITGTPDIIADIVRDIKCSWSIHSFPHEWSYSLDKGYYWQLQGYMALTGLERASLDYCLVNTPEHLIEREKKAIMWMEPDAYDVACEEIERLNRYEDIPELDRVFSIEIERNEKDIQAIYERVELCRQFWDEKIGVAA